MKKIIYFLGVLILYSSFSVAQNDVSKPIVRKPVYFDVSPPLRDMVLAPASKVDQSWKQGVVKNGLNTYNPFRIQNQDGWESDPNIQKAFGQVLTDTTIQNFEGVNNIGGYTPPDTQGDVGPNHYFQVVNCSYAIYNKTGTKLLGPVSSSSMWSGMPHNSNDGDAIVLYDTQADRWLFSQFSLPSYPNGPFYQMIAVSQTPDPTGSWNRYQYSYTEMGDYPKFGVWVDGYYMSVNRFSAQTVNFVGTGAVAFERDKMLIGDPNAQSVELTLTSGNDAYAVLPSNCQGTFPPAGTPNFFTYHNSGPSQLRILEFHVDWITPANSTYTLVSSLPVNSFTGSISGGIAQKGTTRKLDPLAGRIMFSLPFRKFSDHWAMVCNSTVNVGSSVAGIRWYELRNDGATGWSVYQQGTYSPGDNNSRWMGSINIDADNNIALGFSISSTDLYPSIRYTGRVSGDPLGQMTVVERGIVNGGGSQTQPPQGGSTSRWGDYSGMSVDPSQPGVFWYTQEYYQTSSYDGWKTRIASFSFANILQVHATATPSQICAGGSSQLDAAASGGTGTYTYSWASLPAGFTSTIQNPVVSPVVTTRYIATLNDGSSTKHDTAIVTVNEEPTAFAGNDTTYFNTVPLLIVYGQATNYSHIQWLTSGDGTFNVDTLLTCLYTPGTNDRIAGVTLTLQAFPMGACTNTAISDLHLTFVPVGIETAHGTFGINLTPNPSSGIFSLIVNGIKDQELQITISDFNGKTVYQEKSKSSSKDFINTIDLSASPKGVYMLKVQAGAQTRIEKMVIQ